ncbi:MAG: GNAT family N-acetyltransferase [Christensenellaceae bacterium]
MNEKKAIIRSEKPSDYKTVENITREAFWNLNFPGCMEHYLVHVMRSHSDFIPELDFVSELDGKVIANVMYLKAKLVNEKGEEREVISFGPISVLPEYQRKGYGKALLNHTFKIAADMGYGAIVIFGNPSNYVSRGFKCCKRYNVCMEGDVFPTAMMVKELKEGFFDGGKWYYHESPVGELCLDTACVEEFDKQFPEKEKCELPCQEEFYIHSHSVIG